MIIKSLTRKSASFKQLLKYVLRDCGKNTSLDDHLVAKRNIRGKTIPSITQEFIANEANRKVQRSNSIRIYHEILSISVKDRALVTKAMLTDLSDKYLSLRNKNAVSVAVSHYDKQHIHVHFVIGAVESETGKALRVSKSDFSKFKRELENYQMMKYPELSNSVVGHGKSKAEDKISDKEFQVIKRTKAPSEKQQLKYDMDAAYQDALSRADFLHRLSERDIRTYSHRDQIKGVDHGRYFQFGSLGYDSQKLRELDFRDVAISGLQVFRDDLDKRATTKVNDQFDSIEDELDSIRAEASTRQSDRDDIWDRTQIPDTTEPKSDEDLDEESTDTEL